MALVEQLLVPEIMELDKYLELSINQENHDVQEDTYYSSCFDINPKETVWKKFKILLFFLVHYMFFNHWKLTFS